MPSASRDVVAAAEPATKSALLSWLGSPFRLLIRTSLSLALAGGFSLGLYLIIGFAFSLPLAAATPALMQVHGQVQVFGFLVLFVMAVAVQLFPRFHASQLDRPAQVSRGGLLLALGVVLRLLAQPLAIDTGSRPMLLVLSGVLQLVGTLMAVHAFARVIRGGVQPAPSGWRALLPVPMGGSLLLARSTWCCASSWRREPSSSPSLRMRRCCTSSCGGLRRRWSWRCLGASSPGFFCCSQHENGFCARHCCAGRQALSASASSGLSWMAPPRARLVVSLAQLLGAALFVAGLRLYEAPLRASGMPQVTNPTRTWARLAFALLLTAAAANVGIAAAELLGRATALTQISAARHLLAQGFLLPIIVLMAARILPGYSGHMLHRPRLLAGLVL